MLFIVLMLIMLIMLFMLLDHVFTVYIAVFFSFNYVASPSTDCTGVRASVRRMLAPLALTPLVFCKKTMKRVNKKKIAKDGTEVALMALHGLRNMYVQL